MLNVENFALFLSKHGQKKSFQQFQHPLLLLLSPISKKSKKKFSRRFSEKVTNCNLSEIASRAFAWESEPPDCLPEKIPPPGISNQNRMKNQIQNLKSRIKISFAD